MFQIHVSCISRYKAHVQGPKTDTGQNGGHMREERDMSPIQLNQREAMYFK